MSMIDHYKVITVTHHNLDISDIGNFYVQVNDDSSLKERLHEIRDRSDFEELIYLETCNRVCFIIYNNRTISPKELIEFFARVNPELETETIENLNSFVNYYEGEAAIEHLFEMASSMDSLVIGEREIFRQFRKAVESSKEMGLTGDNMRILERVTVQTAKKIYSSTKIAEKALSVVSLAIQAMLGLNSEKQQGILLVGSGETNTLVGKFLNKYKMNNVSIYNRSIDNAQELAHSLGAKSYHLNDLEKVEGAFDTIIICTSANRVVIDNEMYQKMLNGDQSRKLIIDLSVPRNISEEVIEENNVDYIDISRLKEISEINLEYRRKELERAQPIIKEQLMLFREIYEQRQLEKAFSSIPKEIKEIKQKALAEIYNKRIEQMDPQSKELLLEMMDYMEKKCISVPIKKARASLL